VADQKRPPEWPYASDELTPRERNFCHNYLLHDFNLRRACKALKETPSNRHHNYLQDERVINYLKNMVCDMEEKFKSKFERKYEHLEFIRNLCMPMDATTFKGYRPEIAVACIKEMNKMDGHHAATEIKHEIRKDEDVEKGNAVLATLLDEHKKEF
jgi:hypothetical protein